MKMEQGLGNTENTQQPPIISNIDVISNNTGYILTRNNNQEVVVEEQTEQIQNLNNVRNGNLYHLTRNNGNLTTTQDQSIQILRPANQNLIYGVRGNGENYTLTRTPAITDYIFTTNNLQNNDTFTIEGGGSGRCVHVCNASGKIVKIGFVHVSRVRRDGLIDRPYNFEVIINNVNRGFYEITLEDSVGSSRSRTTDVEHLNLFVNRGDCIGCRYGRGSNGRTGEYCQVRLTVDHNARQNNFDGAEIV